MLRTTTFLPIRTQYSTYKTRPIKTTPINKLNVPVLSNKRNHSVVTFCRLWQNHRMSGEHLGLKNVSSLNNQSIMSHHHNVTDAQYVLLRQEQVILKKEKNFRGNSKTGKMGFRDCLMANSRLSVQQQKRLTGEC